MTEHFDTWINDSKKWLDKLEEVVSRQEGSEFYIDYHDVARAFPTQESHPDTFDYPKIEHRRFVEWANENGMDVDLQATDSSHPNQVRFIKR